MSKIMRLKDCAFYVSQKINSEILDKNTYVSTENILQNKLGKTIASFTPKNNTKVTHFKPKDILIANIRPYLKKIWFANHEGGCSADVLVLRARSDTDSSFLYYSLFRDDFFSYIMKGAKGTRMPRGDKEQILKFNIPDMNYQNQKKIGELLFLLDKKIELNNRINAELEAMAKTLYDYWFVQFDFPNEEGKPYKSSGGKMVYNSILKREIPEGWEIGTISEFIASFKGGDWGKETTEGKYTIPVICVRGADINGLNGSGQIGAPKRYILDKNKEKFLLPYDLVIEISGGSPTQSTGRLLLITDEMLSRFDEPLICSNFCKAISLVDHQYAYNFKYMWDSIYDSGVLFGWEGKTSGIKNLLFESFVSKYIICMPAVELVNKFFSFAEDIHKKKQNNLKENEKFIQLRDFLLPMLMNGQVTVK